METLTGRATLEVFFYVGRVTSYYLKARFPYTVSLASVLEQIKVQFIFKLFYSIDLNARV